MKIDELVRKAKKSSSYLLTLTVKDDSRTENDLQHFTERLEFSQDDVIPSLDAAVRSLGIRPPKVPEVKKSPTPPETGRPLKVAIVSHFCRFPESYSPGRAARYFVQTLKEHGHTPCFFATEGSKADVGCELRDVMPRFRREKGVVDEGAKLKVMDVFREHLAEFDCAISFDMYIQDCATYRAAMLDCGVPVAWAHWARSGVGEMLDFGAPNFLHLYLNRADSEKFARHVGTPHDMVRVIYNEKSPDKFFGWHQVSTEIANSLRLWEKDVMSVYPCCSTRMDAKQINSVISVMGALKRAGKSVGLVVCNSNGKRRLDDVKRKLAFAAEHGLVNGEDILFTSTLPEALGTQSEVPNKVVADLMGMSNLMVLPSAAEAGPQILLEAAISGCLLVANSDLPLNFDFVDRGNVIEWPFTSSRHLHYSGRTPDDMDRLAQKIIGQLDAWKADSQRRRTWREHNSEVIYKEMTEPVLYELAGMTKKLRK